MPVKEQTCTLPIVTRQGGRKCDTSVLKPLAAKKRPVYFSPVYCCFPADYIIFVYMMTTLYSFTLRDLFT